MNVTTKVWLFLTLMSLGTILVGYSLIGRLGSFLGLVSSLVLLICFYYSFQVHFFTKLKKQKLNAMDSYGLYPVFFKASQSMQIPLPDIYIYKSSECWAMVAPRAFEDTALYLSEGLAETLDEEEKLAFAALALASFNAKNQTFFITLHLMARAIYKVGVFLDFINPLRFVLARAIHFFAPIFYILGRSLMSLTLQKRHIELIDDDVARVLETPHPLARLLIKMNSWMQSRPFEIEPSLHTLFLITPNSKTNFFNFHSELKLRVQRLIGYYPL